MADEFQSPINRVKCSVEETEEETEEENTSFQSPINRVKCSVKLIFRALKPKVLVSIPYKSGQVFCD